jgi:hypothetical protein
MLVIRSGDWQNSLFCQMFDFDHVNRSMSLGRCKTDENICALDDVLRYSPVCTDSQAHLK